MPGQGSIMKNAAIIVFDGYCNFCSASVLFILKRDPRGHFRFAASQTDAGSRLLKEFGIGGLAEHSIILIEGNLFYERSDAALRIARRLRGGWPVFSLLMIVPRKPRDYLYNWLVVRRYRLFGRRETCYMPENDVRKRFLGV